MKETLIFIISVYQKILSPIKRSIFGDTCRFNPTCSEYAKISVRKNGVIKGSYLAFLRILKCQPYYRSKQTFQTNA